MTVPGLLSHYVARQGAALFQGRRIRPILGDLAYTEKVRLRMTLHTEVAMTRTAAQVLVDQLKYPGRHAHVFCVPGESYLPVLDALVRQRHRRHRLPQRRRRLR